jgi:hypothetical protein
MFAADAFHPGTPFSEQLLDFARHLIPSVILTLILIIAWKYEMAGGILFTLIGIMFTYPIYRNNFYNNQSVSTSLSIVLAITFPFILVGILFILSHIMKKKKSGAYQAGNK